MATDEAVSVLRVVVGAYGAPSQQAGGGGCAALTACRGSGGGWAGTTWRGAAGGLLDRGAVPLRMRRFVAACRV